MKIKAIIIGLAGIATITNINYGNAETKSSAAKEATAKSSAVNQEAAKSTAADAATTKALRKMHYNAEGNAFVVENGDNRYTRPLYGGPDVFRLETSDRPVFATFNNCHNIAFRLICGDDITELDATDYCKSYYHGGRRDYTLRHKTWGDGTLHIAVIARQEGKGAVWQFKTENFKKAVTFEIRTCEAAIKKMPRNGDIGKFYKPGSYEAAENPTELKTKQWQSLNNITYVEFDNADITTGETAKKHFIDDDKTRAELATSVQWQTPDDLLNPVAGALVMAADGAWDGETWLHGAVGWRMQLPGWRAGYLGDFLGMKERAITHFNAYQKSQVNDVPPTIPHPTQDTAANLARGAEKWGTQIYSNGYICRTPGNNHKTHHYDMNLNYVDELLWHFQFDADKAYLKQMWPLLKLHLDWEKRCFDPDNDHLYDAYCCIWASDALYYNGGAGTHSSAYNYRGNRLAAKIAQLIGEDPTPYNKEADEILKAMNSKLWVNEELENGKTYGHWAEYKDFMGLKRTHKDAAVWSIYTPIDCDACTPEQAYQAMQWAAYHYPQIPLAGDDDEFTISTSDWHPYDWSTNNVAMAEVMHTALAYFIAGMPKEGYRLMRACIKDFMYMGKCPGNFGQISYYDAALGESYRDFSDVTGISSRTLLQGLFGITPDALNGQCILRPGFPEEWDSISITTPYIKYKMRREGGKDIYEVTQNFPQQLKIVFRQNIGHGKYKEYIGTTEKTQKFIFDTVKLPDAEDRNTHRPAQEAEREAINEAKEYSGIVNGTLRRTTFKNATENSLGNATAEEIDIKKYYNAKVEDIFNNQYLTPRPPFTSLELPKQGIGDWCSIKRTADIKCKEPIVYTSLWDNYPDSVVIPLSGKGNQLKLTMAGSTNQMQSHIDNGYVKVEYKDGTGELLQLRNPDTWCPIEQDFYNDKMAFSTPFRPERLHFATGKTSRTLSDDLQVKGATRTIPGGAGTILYIPLNSNKKLKSLTLRTLSNDVVIGLMKIELQKVSTKK